jgi:hypothetical protein
MKNNDKDWFKELFTAEDAQQIRAKSERIEEDMFTEYEITFVIPRDQAIELCRHYSMLQDDIPNMRSMMYVGSMITALINTIVEAIYDDGIDPFEDD